jgi:hypothetical protein
LPERAAAQRRRRLPRVTRANILRRKERPLVFRTRLLQTLRAMHSILDEPGILIAGSEVPNLLEPGLAATLVVSQDVDIAVPVERHAGVKQRLRDVKGFARSREEPSVWLPLSAGLLEVNFIGMDTGSSRAGETYVLDDIELPLLVFSGLSLLRPGKVVELEDLRIPLPRPAGLILEKLITDRSGEKGDRDLLVSLAMLLVCERSDQEELVMLYHSLPEELRYSARSGLAALSLLEPRAQMPDPVPNRSLLARLLAEFEAAEKVP